MNFRARIMGASELIDELIMVNPLYPYIPHNVSLGNPTASVGLVPRHPCYYYMRQLPRTKLSPPPSTVHRRSLILV
jgi:hypothetical protein